MILLYQVDTLPGFPALQAVMALHHYPYRLVQPSEYHVPLGQLALGEQCDTPALPTAPFEKPMMVLCGLEGAQVSRFLDLIRSVGAPNIDLKAVLTPTTQGWTSHQLYHELNQEHQYFQNRKGSTP